MSAVVDCLLSLRAYVESAEDNCISPNSLSKDGYLSRKRWKFLEADKMDCIVMPNGGSLQSAENSPLIGDGKRRNISDLKFQGILRSSGTSGNSSCSLQIITTIDTK